MEPSERKLLFAFVRDALSRAGEDTIDTTRRNPRTVQSLRSLGFIDPNENSLTREAFLAYFDTFEEISCPRKVQDWVDRFHISDLHWRRPSTFMTSLMGQGRGKTYPLLATVFIGAKAQDLTWFHELGHVVYARIDKDQVAKLATAAKEKFPVVSGGDAQGAVDPSTMQPIALPEGIYLKMNGHYHGLDHSGPGADAESDELWAVLFGGYCQDFEFPPRVRGILEKIIEDLMTRQESAH
jgi:hypothetical protein